jgi:hypothetical protein
MRLDYAMRVVSLLATVALSPARVDRQPIELSRVERVEPAAAKAGAIVTAFGVNLNRSRVVDLILSQGDMIMLAHIVEQRDELIRFRIPRSALSAKYRIALVIEQLWGPTMVGQQVFFEILPGDVITLSVPPVGAKDPGHQPEG